MMADPVFTNRADLETWSEKYAGRMKWNIQMAPDAQSKHAALDKGIETLKRVILAHRHILYEQEKPHEG